MNRLPVLAPPDVHRAHILAALEAAIGEGIDVADPTADELLAAADRAGAVLAELLEYIAARPEDGFSAPGFERWLEAREKESE